MFEKKTTTDCRIAHSHCHYYMYISIGKFQDTFQCFYRQNRPIRIFSTSPTFPCSKWTRSNVKINKQAKTCWNRPWYGSLADTCKGLIAFCYRRYFVTNKSYITCYNFGIDCYFSSYTSVRSRRMTLVSASVHGLLWYLPYPLYYTLVNPIGGHCARFAVICFKLHQGQCKPTGSKYVQMKFQIAAFAVPLPGRLTTINAPVHS